MQATESRYDLIGKLWYHGPMQQREAESTLHECAEELKLKSQTCYLVREHRGTLYLSIKSSGMCYHIIVHRMTSPKGFCLEGHHNIYQSLEELITHHQQNPIYVDGGDFLLNCCCHKEYVAYAIRYINDYKGPCILQVRPDTLVVKKSNGVALGSWGYSVIREFKFDDMEKSFMFTSGRRGPFGVANYNFDLHDRIYYSIRETVNCIARGGAPEPSPHRSSLKAAPKSGDGGIPLHHISGGSVGTGVSRLKERQQRKGEYDNECYVQSIPRDTLTPPPPVPPHANNRRRSHGISPTVLSVAPNRSSSIPDLRENVIMRADSTNSVKVSPVHTVNFRSSATSSSSSTGGDASVCDSDDSSFDTTNPHAGDYQVPRNEDDSRNDYQVPRPVDETYMVPRKSYDIGVKKNLEHSYEDPDIMFGDKVNTIKIKSRLS